MLNRIKKMLGLIPYVSEMDQFLLSFNQKTKLSVSQEKEIARTLPIAKQAESVKSTASQNSDKQAIMEFLG